jgi:hypothetical protein
MLRYVWADTSDQTGFCHAAKGRQAEIYWEKIFSVSLPLSVPFSVRTGWRKRSLLTPGVIFCTPCIITALKENNAKLVRLRISILLVVIRFLGAFAKLRKATIGFVMYACPSFCLSVCLSVRMEHPGSHWTDFHEIWYLRIFRKSVEKLQVPLKSDKNNWYFTWRPMYIYDISLSSS